MATIRKRRNKVTCLLLDNGDRIYEESELNSMVIDFYGQLYSDDGSNVSHSTLHGFPIIDSVLMCSVSRDITMEDV